MRCGLYVSSPAHQEHRGVYCLNMNIVKGHEGTEYFPKEVQMDITIYEKHNTR